MTAPASAVMKPLVGGTKTTGRAASAIRNCAKIASMRPKVAVISARMMETGIALQFVSTVSNIAKLVTCTFTKDNASRSMPVIAMRRDVHDETWRLQRRMSRK